MSAGLFFVGVLAGFAAGLEMAFGWASVVVLDEKRSRKYMWGMVISWAVAIGSLLSIAVVMS